MKDRLARWALRRAYGRAGDAGGVRLLVVDSEGRVGDLGTYAVKDLRALVWATGVAYRCTPIRWERTKLAGLKGVARGLAVGLSHIGHD